MTNTLKQTHGKLTAISHCESSGELSVHEYGVSSHIYWATMQRPQSNLRPNDWQATMLLTVPLNANGTK